MDAGNVSRWFGLIKGTVFLRKEVRELELLNFEL